MGETTIHLEQHIGAKRQDLTEHIHELQHKAKDAVDWRYQTGEHPWTMMSLAFGAGLLAAVVAGISRAPAPARPRSGAASRFDDEPNHLWSNIKYAAGAAALARVRDLTKDAVPGFWENYAQRDPRVPADRDPGV